MAKVYVDNVQDEFKIFDILQAISDRFDEDLFLDEKRLKEYAHKLYKKGNVLGAYYDNQLVGVLAYYYNDESVEQMGYVPILALVSEIYEKMFIRAKAMSALLFRAREEMMEKGAKCVRVEVKNDNTNAIEIYERLGAVIEGPASDKSIYMRFEWDDIPY